MSLRQPGGGNTHYSEDTSREIDQEVRSILNDAYSTASKLLEDNRDILEAMKDALMEFETIDADQVDDLMNRRKVRPPSNGMTMTRHTSGGGNSTSERLCLMRVQIGGPVEEL